MGLVPCPIPCHTIKESDSSPNSSLSSQPSLPSVPSLTSSLSQTTTHNHHCLATLKTSSCISSLALSSNTFFFFTGSSNSEIRIWNKDAFTLQSPTKNNNNNVIATGNGDAVKSLLVLNDKLISAHQDHKIRVWKIGKKSTYECVATLPTFNDRFTRIFSNKNYVQVRRHKKSTWVHHVDTVSSLAVSSDGSILYSSSWDRSFKIWRVSDFKCLESVNNAHDDAINAIAVSYDGYVYTGSADKKIKVWKKRDGEKKHSLVDVLEKHRSAVNALAIDESSVLYSGACDRSILVWEREGGQLALTGALRGHTKAILCLVVVMGLVCSGSADNTVRIWRRGSEEKRYCCLAVFEGHKRPVKCLTAAVDDDDGDVGYLTVYSGSLDCDIKIWKIGIPFL